MTSRLAVLVIDALEPPRIAEFWCEVLGWQVAAVDDADMSIGPADGTSPTIDVCRVRKRKKGKDWLHLDLRAAGVPTEVELPRLLDLGATRVDVGRSVERRHLAGPGRSGGP